MRYTRIEHDGDGGSRFREDELALSPTAVVPGEGPLHVSHHEAGGLQFVAIPDDFVESTWHPAPRRQFVLVLSGVTEFETTDGDVRRFGPGEVLLFTDVVGRGHLGRPVERPLRVAFVPVPE